MWRHADKNQIFCAVTRFLHSRGCQLSGKSCTRITVKQPRIGASIMAEADKKIIENEAVPDARFSSHGYLDFRTGYGMRY